MTSSSSARFDDSGVFPGADGAYDGHGPGSVAGSARSGSSFQFRGTMVSEAVAAARARLLREKHVQEQALEQQEAKKREEEEVRQRRNEQLASQVRLLVR